MGISNVMAHWFEGLHARGVFKGLRSVLELGPQDLVLSRPVLANFATRVTGVEHCLVATETIFFENSQVRWWTATRDFYAMLGLDDYHGADIDDQRADYSIDLNKPTQLGRQFDVITNFGTAEHLFNLPNAMELIHDHLKPGGVALHVMPTRGQYNHGFYAINSTFYRNLAQYNHYEVVDLVNVPDFGGQHEFLDKHEKAGDRPPRASILVDIRTTDDAAREREFAKLVVERPADASQVFDYVFAAFRKTADAPFVQPQQTDSQASHGAALGAPRDKTESLFVAQFGPALAYFRGQRWSEAEARARAALEVAPNHPDALHVLGLVYAHTGRGADAIHTLKRVYSLAPQNVEVLKNLAAVLRAMGQLDDAIACFRQIIATTPNAVDAHFNLAGAVQQKGDLAGAATLYRRVLSLEPGHAGARQALAGLEPRPLMDAEGIKGILGKTNY